jgi:hypothetical protein
MEAARLVYSYRAPRGRIREMTVTALGASATYQIVCEAPESKFSEYQDLFEFCIESFALGKEPAVGQPLPESAAASSQTAVGIYNQGVGQFAAGQFDPAERSFKRAQDARDCPEALKMVAARARAICLARLNRTADAPERLTGQTAEAGCAYLAYNAAGQLLNDGHRAAISAEDPSRVEARIGTERFRLQFTSLFGQFVLNAWRVEEGQITPVAALKNATGALSSVRYLESVLDVIRNGAPPPVRIPESGIPGRL